MFIEWIELKKKWGIGIILRPEQKSTEGLKKDLLPDAQVQVTPIPHIWPIWCFLLKMFLIFCESFLLPYSFRIPSVES